MKPWLLVTALATLGVLGGHEAAYAVTGAPAGDVHTYLDHLPQVALLLTLLSLAGASLVSRRGRIALWPFPVVTVVGFFAQEHIERLQPTGSLPFLLTEPVFVVGIAIQCAVAVLAWLAARALVRIVVTEVHARLPVRWTLWLRWAERALFAGPLVQRARSRAPPAIS